MAQTLIYVTAGSRNEALAIARELVNSRLAACANILAGTTSVYHWEGEVCEEDEVSMILKTRDDLVDRLVEKYAAPRDLISDDVIAMLQDLADKGFVVDASTA